MDFYFFREYCLAKPFATEDTPFDEITFCFRVGGKIFCLTDMESNPVRLNLKCDPEKAIELRAEYEYITPGYHMNKKHWNTVEVDSAVDLALVKEMIDDSYEIVFKSLSKKEREKFALQSPK